MNNCDQTPIRFATLHNSDWEVVRGNVTWLVDITNNL